MINNGKKVKVFLAWPSCGQREDLHLYLLRDLQDRYGEIMELRLPDICIHRVFHDFARNEMCEEFLASDCDVMWFLDSDVAPPPHVLDLIAHHYDKWQCAGAPYPIANIAPGQDNFGINFCVYKGVDFDKSNPEVRGIYMADLPPDGHEFVDGLATGCLFVKREVLEKMERPYFEFKFNKETRRITEGEDLGFALKCHDLGIKFYVDYSAVCGHNKRVNLLEMSNFAMRMRNDEIRKYVDQVKPDVEAAVKEAYQRGREKGRQEAASSAPVIPGRTKSGLILPQDFAR